jgi:chromate transporter
VRPFEAGLLHFDLPVLSSVDPWALLLSAAAVVAVLRFKTGTISTLAATSAAGIALYLAGVTA